jgi:hypothetical protein
VLDVVDGGREAALEIGDDPERQLSADMPP